MMKQTKNFPSGYHLEAAEKNLVSRLSVKENRTDKPEYFYLHEQRNCRGIWLRDPPIIPLSAADIGWGVDKNLREPQSVATEIHVGKS